MRKAHATSEIERYVDRWMDGKERDKGGEQSATGCQPPLARREEAIGTMTPLCSGRRLPGGRREDVEEPRHAREEAASRNHVIDR